MENKKFLLMEKEEIPAQIKIKSTQQIASDSTVKIA